MQTQLRDVEYFAVIAEHGQVQRAAEALGLSQPALSKSLRRLEQAMKAKLLRRTPKGVELTSVGSALLAQVRKLRMSVDDVTREIADLSEGRAGHLRIGTSPGSALRLLPTACAAMLKESPNVTLNITAGDNNSMLAGLRHGELDFAVTMLQGNRHEDLTEEYVHDEEFKIYASANHRLARRKQLALADLVGERWVLTAADGPMARHLSQALANRGLPAPRISIETTNLPARYHLVAATNLLSLGAEAGVRYAAERFPLVALRVRGYAHTRRGGVIYRKDAYLSPAARRFIEILKATTKEIAAERP